MQQLPKPTVLETLAAQLGGVGAGPSVAAPASITINVGAGGNVTLLMGSAPPDQAAPSGPGTPS